MKTKGIVFLIFLAVSLAILIFGFPGAAIGPSVSAEQDAGWKVFVKTSPCSGRLDWVVVGQTNPTGLGGSDYWETADRVVVGTPLGCVKAGSKCTKAEAEAEAAIVRASPKFKDYCCQNYSVWKNTQTGKLSIVVGQFGNPGLGWQFEDGPMCCDEAESITGLTNTCGSSGSNHGGSAGQGFTQLANNNINGKTLTFYRGTTPEKCQADCAANPLCKAFALVKAGFYNPSDPPMCYLVAEVTSQNASPCCTSAIKTGAATAPTADDADLSGTWTTPYVLGNIRNTWYLQLARQAKNKWSGTQTSVRQDGTLSAPATPVTLEYLGNGKVRYTYLTQRADGGIKADATFANGKLTIRFASGDVAVYSREK